MSGYGDKPFGLREIKLVNIGGTVVAPLPAAMKLSFKERLVSGEMRGNDVVQALVAITDAVEWSLENGGLSLEAWAMMTGRTVTETGTTPTQINTMNIDGGQVYPYFKVYGKSIGENANDDIHIKLYKCKLTGSLEGEFADGSFFVTSCSGLALPDGTNGIADVVQNETAADLPTA
jgi:hypothetical protein